MARRFEVVPFWKFETIVCDFLGIEPDRWFVPRQVTYLKSYLANFQASVDGECEVRPAQSIVVEQLYTDRHYLEEFTAYYSTLLEPPPQTTTRLHFFQLAPNSIDLTAILEATAESGAIRFEEQYEATYLGCVSLRPIRNAVIGRALLKPYEGNASRTYGTALRNSSVRVAGLELAIRALPFFQQDQGVGACATAAVWSALSKACRDVGMRSPTPYSVTRAATSSVVNDRRFPATSGLDLSQMATAIQVHGLEPLLLKVSNSPAHFMWSLKANLQSGIPAVLFFKGQEEHAVAVSGYKRDAVNLITLDPSPECPGDIVRTEGMKHLYVHDDRIGPYVKMQISEVFVQSSSDGGSVGQDPEKKPECVGFELRRLRSGKDELDARDQEFFEGSRIWYAIFPTYPKMRMGAVELGDIAGKVLPLIRLLASVFSDDLSVDGWFEQNGVYMNRLFRMGTNPKRVASFAQEVRLSRYVGVLRWKIGEAIFADVVCDTTDVPRGDYSLVRGVFMFDEGVATSSTYASYQAALPNAVLI